MSILKQILVSIIILAMAAGGWVLYQRWDELFGGGETVTAGGPPGAPAGREAGRGGAPGGNGAGAPAAPGAGAPAAPGAPGAGAGGPGGRRGGFGGPALVVTAPVTIDRTGSELVAIGSLESARAATLFPQASGVITAVPVQSGATVAEGDLLFQLDDADQRIAVERAALALASAEAGVERAERLAESQNITDVALADARKALEAARIDARAAELALQRRAVLAPFAGTVGLVNVGIGDAAAPASALATLDDMSSFMVSFAAPQSFVGRLRPGHPVTATAEGLPGRDIAGEVSAVDSRLDEATRTFTVRALLSSGLDGLKPGMAVSVRLVFEGEPFPAVPSLAIQWDRTGPFVWKLIDDKVKRTAVSIVGRRAGTVVVAAELAESDPVVVEGLQRLRDGMAVATAGGGPAADRPAGAAPAGGPAAAAQAGAGRNG